MKLNKKLLAYGEASMVALYGIVNIAYPDNGVPPILWAAGPVLLAVWLGADIYKAHRESIKYRQEIAREVGQDRLEEKLGKIRELHDNASVHFFGLE